MSSLQNNKQNIIKSITLYKNICQKEGINQNSSFLQGLKQNAPIIVIDNYSYKDLSPIAKVISENSQIESLLITSLNQNETKESKENQSNSKLNLIIKAVSTNLIQKSTFLVCLRLDSIDLSYNNCVQLGKAIKSNSSLEQFQMSNLKITSNPEKSMEIVINGLLNHEHITKLSITHCELNDRLSNTISRLISSQGYRQDKIHDEDEGKGKVNIKGLISIDFSFNKFSDGLCERLSFILENDNHIKNINLSNNDISSVGCKAMIKSLRVNNTIINLDLRENMGYNDNIHMRLVVKLSKNIRFFYETSKSTGKSQEYKEMIMNIVDESIFKHSLKADENKLEEENQVKPSQKEEESVFQRENEEKVVNEIISLAVQKFDGHSFIKPYLKTIVYLKESIEKLKEENKEYNEIIKKGRKTHSSLPSNTQTTNTKKEKFEKGGISLLSSNEEIVNPFTNNQNITHMTKFYEMNPDQISAKIQSVIGEITKKFDVGETVPYSINIQKLTSQFGGGRKESELSK